MKFFKNKEKQRFSLRKNKAYGLASALLGVTLVGTMIMTDSLPNSLSAKAWDWIGTPTLTANDLHVYNEIPERRSVPAYKDGVYWQDVTIEKRTANDLWTYYGSAPSGYHLERMSQFSVYFASNSSGSSSSGYGSSSSSDYNSGSSSSSTYGNIHDQPSGPKYIVDDKLNYGENNYDSATGIWHVGTTPTTRTEEIPSTTKKYVKDPSRTRGSQPIENPGTPG